MTKEDWQDERIIKGWTDANGSKTWPFGDNWRMALINPVIIHAAKMVQDEKGFRPDHPESLYREIAIQREIHFRTEPADYGAAKAALERWHENPFDQKDAAKRSGEHDAGSNFGNALDRVCILDLGCGEAYRSRWLSRFGIQYLGIDGSSQLIGTAESRRKAALPKEARKIIKQHTYNMFDFEDPDINFDSLCNGFEPNLAIAITCFDHLSKPQSLVGKLSTFLGKFPRPVPLLVVTLNPRHYDEHLGVNPADTLNEEANKYFGTKRKAVIESASSSRTSIPTAGRPKEEESSADTSHKVNVYYRSLRDWEETFTNGNFHILRVSPLQFSDYTVLAALRREVAKANVFYEASPFYAWFLYPKKVGRPANTTELDAAIAESAPGIFADLSPDERRAIRTVLENETNKLQVIEFSKEERILFPHNLGGDVCIVLKGSAHLTESDGVPLQNFQEGDILGELETEWIPISQSRADPKEKMRKYMIRRYIYPVDAGPNGATLLLVPREVFAKIANVGDMASFAGELFQNLRDKLLINVWQFFGERIKTPDGQKEWKIKSNKYSASKSLDSQRLQRVAKGIMSLASVEAHNPSRDTDGNTIFCGPVELAFLLTENATFVVKVLKLFDSLGLIRWYSGEVFSTRDGGVGVMAMAIGATSTTNISVEDRANEEWKKWKELAFRYLVARPLAQQHEKSEETLARCFDLGGSGLPIRNLIFGTSPTTGKFGLLKTPKDDLEVCVRKLMDQGITLPDAKKAARNWLANIGYVNSRIVHGRGTGNMREGQIIRITASHELRRLAFDENEFNRLFVDRLGAFPESQKGGSGGDGLQTARARRYCEIIGSFLKTAWERGGSCNMTGSAQLRSLKGWNDVSDFERMIDEAAP